MVPAASAQSGSLTPVLSNTLVGAKLSSGAVELSCVLALALSWSQPGVGQMSLCSDGIGAGSVWQRLGEESS